MSGVPNRQWRHTVIKFDAEHAAVHYPPDRRHRLWIRPSILIGIAAVIASLVAAAWIEMAVAGLPHIPPVPVVYPNNFAGPHGFPLWVRYRHHHRHQRRLHPEFRWCCGWWPWWWWRYALSGSSIRCWSSASRRCWNAIRGSPRTACCGRGAAFARRLARLSAPSAAHLGGGEINPAALAGLREFVLEQLPQPPSSRSCASGLGTRGMPGAIARRT